MKLYFCMLFCIAVFAAPAVAQKAAENIQARVENARSEHGLVIESQRKDLVKQLEAKREVAKRRGNLALLEKLDLEQDLLVDSGAYPSLIRTSKTKAAVRRANNVFLKALKDAEVDFVKANLVDDAKLLREERERFTRLFSESTLSTVGGKDTDEAEWTELLTGPSLAGWKPAGERNSRWYVENGILNGASKGLSTVLHTEKNDYSNFHLRVETMLSEGANSGIYVGWHTNGKGYVVKIGGTGSETAYGATGDICRQVEWRGKPIGIQNPPLVALRKDTWFTQEIIYTDGEIRVYVDGTLISQHAESAFGNAGCIALLCRGKSIARFRSVKIKPVAPPKD